MNKLAIMAFTLSKCVQENKHIQLRGKAVRKSVKTIFKAQAHNSQNDEDHWSNTQREKVMVYFSRKPYVFYMFKYLLVV